MNRLRVLLLLAWRDVLRHKGRSLLIVALVALPVLVIGAADVLYRSTQATPLEQVDGELGASSAFLSAPAGATRVDQDPTENSPAQFTTGRTVKDPAGDYPEPVDVSTAPLKPADQVLPLLPAGSVITPWEHGQVPISIDGGHYRMVTADLLNLASAAAAGRYRLVDGAPATGTTQITVTTTLANQIGATIGSTVSVGSPASSRSVVGLLEPTSRASNALAVVGRPGSIPGATDYHGPRYLVTSPRPISWDMVQQLNSHGIQAYSRAVVLNPPYVPPDAQQPFDSTAALALVAGIVLAVLGLAQVVFLSGPAFAIGARRMRRQLGLATSVGAAPRQIAGVVLSSGLVLGLIGALLGAALGAIVGAVVQPLVTSWTHLQFAAVHIRVGELAVVAAVGVVTSVLAASWPAVTALRTDPISALSRRTRPPKKPGLISLVGLLLAVAGVVIVVVAASRSVPTGEQVDLAGITQQRAIWIAAGVLATQLGLIVGAPQIVAVFGRLGSIVPTTPRLALRSTARHRGRSTGAIATVLVATTGAVLGAVLISTTNAQNAADYRPSLAMNVVAGHAYPNDQQSPAAERAPVLTPPHLAAMAHLVWPDTAIASWGFLTPLEPAPRPDQRAPDLLPQMPRANQCPWYSPANSTTASDAVVTQPSAAQLPAARTDPRCADMTFSAVSAQQTNTATSGFGQSQLPSVVVAGADFRQILSGAADPAADAALAAGKVVVLDRRYLNERGMFTVTDTTYDPNTGHPISGASHSLPAVLGAWGLSSVVAVVPPSAVSQLGGRTGDVGFLAHPTTVTATEQEAMSAAGLAAGYYLYPYAELGPAPVRGAPSVWLILLVAAALIVGTVLVVTALGVVDADDDSATFAAVGASARLRRALSGWSAFTTTGIGCLLGAIAGLIVGWGFVRLLDNENHQQTPMTVPWPQLAILVFGLPAVAYGLAAAFTRSKIQLIRRAE